MSGTIDSWERERFEREAAASIAAVPMTNAVVERPERTEDVPSDLAVWAARSASGFYVQGLVAGKRTFITAVLGAQCETFEVEPEHAVEAFEHPFAFGCTITI
jgi:hypothetical protein